MIGFESEEKLANRRHESRLSAAITGQPFGFFPKGRLSRKCNGSRGKKVRTCEQKVNKEEKLTLTFHRNLLIVLGKLPLRQIISK